MKNKMSKWVREKGEILQEISQDISWYKEKLVEKAQNSNLGTDLLKKYREALPEQEPEEPQIVYIPDPWEEEKTLREKLDWAIRRAYCKEGGYRYYGCNLVRYVKVVLPSQTDFQTVWTAGYNSCIDPMLRQLEKLELEMGKLQPLSGKANLELENALLLERMRQFRQLAYDRKLHLDTDWELDDYRQVLTDYAEELNRLLLTPFKLQSAQ